MWERATVGGLASLGSIVLGSAIWHYSVFDAPPTDGVHGLVTIVAIGGAGAGLLYAVHWHRQRSFAPGRYLQIGAWTGLGAVLIGSVGVIVLYAGSRRVSPHELVEAGHIAGSVGLAAGVLVGTLSANSLRNAETAARAEARAEMLRTRQERLDELNELLRHYVLNGMQVIGGYTETLRAEVPEDEHGQLEVIEEQTDAVTTLVEHFRSVSKALAETRSTVTIDTEAVVRTATNRCQSLPFVIEAPEDVPPVDGSDVAEATTLLCEGFSEIAEADEPVTVSIAVRESVVQVSITATPNIRWRTTNHSPFEAGGSPAALRLYLAKLLLEQSGSVEVLEDNDERLGIMITLPRAAATA